MDALARVAHAEAGEARAGEFRRIAAAVAGVIHIDRVDRTLPVDHDFSVDGMDIAGCARSEAAEIDGGTGTGIQSRQRSGIGALDIERGAAGAEIDGQRFDGRVLNALGGVAHAEAGELAAREESGVRRAVVRVVDVHGVGGTLAVDGQFPGDGIDVTRRARGDAADIDHGGTRAGVERCQRRAVGALDIKGASARSKVNDQRSDAAVIDALGGSAHAETSQPRTGEQTGVGGAVVRVVDVDRVRTAAGDREPAIDVVDRVTRVADVDGVGPGARDDRGIGREIPDIEGVVVITTVERHRGRCAVYRESVVAAKAVDRQRFEIRIVDGFAAHRDLRAADRVAVRIGGAIDGKRVAGAAARIADRDGA